MGKYDTPIEILEERLAEDQNDLQRAKENLVRTQAEVTQLSESCLTLQDSIDALKKGNTSVKAKT